MPALDRSHYGGDYAARARKVREAANADGSYRCPRCGEGARAGDPWEAGHSVDADSSAPLRAEHASCNRSAGRRAQLLNTSRRWF